MSNGTVHEILLDEANKPMLARDDIFVSCRPRTVTSDTLKSMARGAVVPSQISALRLSIKGY